MNSALYMKIVRMTDAQLERIVDAPEGEVTDEVAELASDELDRRSEDAYQRLLSGPPADYIEPLDMPSYAS